MKNVKNLKPLLAAVEATFDTEDYQQAVEVAHAEARKLELQDIADALEDGELLGQPFNWTDMLPADTHRWAGTVELPAADLANIDLPDANFVGASLCGTDFSKANLENANFNGADLVKTDFNNANLHNVIFYSAIALFADFSGANLQNADFTNADLESADFSGANLIGANFTNANLKGTDFTDTDLQNANLKKAKKYRN